MAEVTGLTADRMEELVGETIIAARIQNTHLILISRNGDELDLGKIQYVESDLEGILEGQVPPLVMVALANDPDLRQVGLVSVSNAIQALDLVEARRIPLLNAAGLGIAITFEDGSRSFLETDQRGRPSTLSISLIVEATQKSMGAALGLETRTDIALPGVRAIYAFENDYIFAYVYTDGSVKYVKPFADAAPTSIWPATAAGDSTTYGADLGAPLTERWSVYLMSYVNQVIDNRGLSGSRAEEIMARLSGVLFSAQPDSATVPPTGAVQLSNLSIDPYRAGSGASPFLVDALTDDNKIIRGTVSTSSGKRLFSRAVAGDAISTKRLVFRAVAEDRNKLLFLGAGINNEPLIVDGTQSLSDVIGWYQSATSLWKGPLVLWGVLDRGPAEKAGTVIGDYIRQLESWLRSTYGASYAPLRQYLATPQAFEDAKRFQPDFVPTQADLDAQAVGTVPPSFRSGVNSVHLNNLGHRLQALFLYRHLLLRGLI